MPFAAWTAPGIARACSPSARSASPSPWAQSCPGRTHARPRARLARLVGQRSSSPAPLLGAPVFRLGRPALLFFKDGTPDRRRVAEVYRLIASLTILFIPLLITAGLRSRPATSARLAALLRGPLWMPGIAIVAAVACAASPDGGSGLHHHGPGASCSGCRPRPAIRKGSLNGDGVREPGLPSRRACPSSVRDRGRRSCGRLYLASLLPGLLSSPSLRYAAARGMHGEGRIWPGRRGRRGVWAAKSRACRSS
jgi:hypothetical protein